MKSRAVLNVWITLVVMGLVLLLLFAAGAIGGHRTGATRSQVALLQSIERSRLHALVISDTNTARRLMAPNFHLINPAGERLSRSAYLGAVGSGEIDYRVFKPLSPIAVQLSGVIAVLQYKVRFDLVASGLRLAHDAWVTTLYEREHVGWRVVWEQATAIPNHPDSLLNALRP